MACDAATLFTAACDADFAGAAQNEVQFRALVLQMLYEASGSTATLTELETSACSNGFMQVAQDETLYRAIELQLLCQITGG